MPNNVKKMCGLPLTRVSGRRKRKQKEVKKRNIINFKFFGIIEEIIDRAIRKQITHNQFVDVNCVNICDKDCGRRLPHRQIFLNKIPV